MGQKLTTSQQFHASLQSALFSCNVDQVRALLDNMPAGVDVNDADARGRTAVCTAALRPNVDALKAVIQKGADVNRASKKDGYALLIAVRNRRTENVIELLRAGADTRSSEPLSRFNTPLMVAIVAQVPEIVQAICDATPVEAQAAWTESRDAQRRILGLVQQTPHPDMDRGIEILAIVGKFLGHGGEQQQTGV